MYPPPLASMGIFWGQWCCWDAALYAVIYSCMFMPGFGWAVTSMHKEKNKYFPLNCGLAVFLGLGLGKGRGKLIVYTHKEFTLRHKAACKAK